MDFAKGQNKLAFEVQGAGSSEKQGTFAMFDSSHNGDAHVRVRSQCPARPRGACAGRRPDGHRLGPDRPHGERFLIHLDAALPG